MNDYPKTDELMYYDFSEHRYILTPKDVLDHLGENLTRLNRSGANNIENVARNFLNQISLEIYNFIFSCNTNNRAQEYILAKSKSAREIIQKAMEQQVLYVLSNGDLHMYSGVDIRKGQVMQSFAERVISPLAKQYLSKMIPEIGCSILYPGFLHICVPSYEKGGY